MVGIITSIKYFLLSFILLFSSVTYAQQFQLNGNASSLGSNIYQLTPATNWQFGAIWNKVQHNLNNPFSVQGQMYFGTLSGGADGIVFVMQNKCLVDGAGAAGGGIGYGGMLGQSIGVEFDTFQNNTGSTPNNSDPAYDHVAIGKNGNGDHANAANNLAGPIQLVPGKTSVKDGIWYDFNITYNPATTTLQVYFNGSLSISLVYDIKANIFGGNPYVYWGFVSATGGSFNDQEVKITSNPTSVISDVTMCAGSSIQEHLPALSSSNIALGKIAVTSSNNGGNVGSNAIDGNGTPSGGTRWESQQGIDPQWIYIDLVYLSDIDSVVLYWENANAKQYVIQTSTDATTWTTQFTESAGPTGNYWKKIVFSATNVRYVRMYGTQRNTGYGYSLYEFRVLGKQKYVWSPNDGSIDNIYSSDPIFSPTTTTTYSVNLVDPCLGIVPLSFTININCTLPIDLLEFKGAVVNKNVQLKWTTAFENNSNYFEVLRSFDGINFTSLGQIKAIGNSKANTNYQFIDDATYSGIGYYQLKEVDLDNKMHKSVVTEVMKNDTKSYVVHPIFEDETLLQFPSHLEYVNYRIIDMLGREIYYHEIVSPSISEVIGKNLTPGVYNLIIESNISSESIKVNKLR